MKAKKESNLLNMLLTLLVVTLVSGLSLGYVNEITKGPKAKAKLERKIDALKKVLPSFDNNPVAERILIKEAQVKASIELFPAYSGKDFKGVAVIGSSNKGFSGLVKLMIGFNPDGTIRNVEVLSQKETPGLGTKMKDVKFSKQFKGKNPSKEKLVVIKDGGQIDALTGATITSRAYCESVQMASETFQKNKKLIQNK